MFQISSLFLEEKQKSVAPSYTTENHEPSPVIESILLLIIIILRLFFDLFSSIILMFACTIRCLWAASSALKASEQRKLEQRLYSQRNMVYGTLCRSSL